ncbi:MAG: hypothetical protein H6601_04710 [Flavobacteriales bacterium]|nr:hypothetical protein [Flavobacteriales bacterium]
MIGASANKHISLIILFLLFGGSLLAQDSLLLTNGKIRNLKATVVYYDYTDVLYQSSTQKEKMEAQLEKLKLKEDAMRQTDAWKARQESIAAKAENKKQRLLQLIEKRKANLKERAEKLNNPESDPAEFERWKSREEADIRTLEQQLVFDSTFQANLVETIYEEKKGKVRNRYTKRVARQLVFSILRADGTEEVVYNADTLGLLADGEFEKEYGVEEMRLYIKGRQDGRKHSFSDVYIGASTGLVSGLLFTYFLDLFYAPIPPAIGVIALAARNNFKPSKKLNIDPSLLESEAYMDGYIQSAKGRKILAFTVGAIGGMGVGIGVAVATSPMLQSR